MITTKSKSRPQSEIEDLLKQANVRINGDRPWDLQIHDDRFFDRVLAHGTLGLGEAYMQGWWDCQSVDEFFSQCLRGGLQEKVERKPLLILSVTLALLLFCCNPAQAKRSRQPEEDEPSPATKRKGGRGN